MGAVKTVSVSIAVLAVLAYFYYPPLPPCFDSLPDNSRLVLRAIPLQNIIGNLIEKLGIMTSWEMNRATTAYVMPTEEDTEALSTINTSFDGVNVRVYLPTQRKPNGPAFFFIHGGGWAVGSITMYDKLVRSVADQENIVAVSVDYRLAPESPYPAAIDDAEKAFRHFVKHAAEYNVDTSRIAVAGDSAGGNLAAALAIRLRDSAALAKKTAADAKDAKAENQVAVVQPKTQILLYPVLLNANYSTLSMLINKDDFLLSRRNMLAFVLAYTLGMDYYNSTLRSLSTQYVEQACFRQKYAHVERVYANSKQGDLRQRIVSDSDRAFLSSFGKDANERQLLSPTCNIKDQQRLDELHSRFAPVFKADFSPLFSDSVEGLPPAHVLSCGCDILRDDAHLYVERLRDAGVHVEHTYYEKDCHGVFSLDINRGVKYLRDALAKSF